MKLIRAKTNGNPVLSIDVSILSVETLHRPPKPSQDAFVLRYGEEKVQTPNQRIYLGRENDSGQESAGRGFESLCGLQIFASGPDPEENRAELS